VAPSLPERHASVDPIFNSLNRRVTAVTTKKSTKTNETKPAAKKTRATKAAEPQKTRCVCISTTAEARCHAFVDVPIDATEEELEQIARDTVECSWWELDDFMEMLDYEVEELEEGDTTEGDCLAVRTEDGIKIVKKE
jgi:hypothetical protein